jgi:hypothetical protein
MKIAQISLCFANRNDHNLQERKELYIKKNKDWFGNVLKKYVSTSKDKVDELSRRF